ncbi:diphosphomevalonate decarboxylase [Caerostris extrusa]|uniref:Diphosphomevalonate decarboxylase n=1 Tax=Caerostris extrusa TaxID=172846 RepID=A0AAV4SDE0_CAEEX|nr:diphosphomevalonate decarboxylase [Caerostris extrusa]
MKINIITAVAPVNIAVIKYWGKRNEDLILPVNDSISVTLSKKEMCAKTSVACSEYFECDRMWLNGKIYNIYDNVKIIHRPYVFHHMEQDMQTPRLQRCIAELKKRGKNTKVKNFHLHICSENNFPTAAGLASSAAGFACLVKALSALYEVEGDLSEIARQGSGSASRSIYGGFVHWTAGINEDGSDSIAQQIAPKEHWPEMRAIILVVNASKKEVSSTKGMQLSVITSSLLNYRTSNIVPARVKSIKKAILEKDFETFAEITMKESNQFHAICLDTFPPIHYLNSVSYKIISLMHSYNEFYGENKVAYTFDAGPNACLYVLEKNVPEIISLIKTIFLPVHDDASFIKGLNTYHVSISKMLLDSLQITPEPGAIKYIINTQIGDGPAILSETGLHLLNEKGFPLSKC